MAPWAAIPLQILFSPWGLVAGVLVWSHWHVYEWGENAEKARSARATLAANQRIAINTGQTLARVRAAERDRLDALEKAREALSKVPPPAKACEPELPPEVARQINRAIRNLNKSGQ